MKNFKYIYGPVYSWRLGRSLGVDALSRDKKACNFNCVYCQIGKTKNYITERKVYVPTKKIIEEIKNLPKVKIDHITFSGRGEPTLAKNLGDAIREIKRLRPEPVAVLTNSSLIVFRDVRKDLAAADMVSFKIDAFSPQSFSLINRPAKGILFGDIIEGIKKFKKLYKGKTAIQAMFTKDNLKDAKKVAGVIKSIKPNRVELNTPLRPGAKRFLSRSEMRDVKKFFKGLKTISVYDKPRKEIKPINRRDTLRRRGRI